VKRSLYLAAVGEDGARVGESWRHTARGSRVKADVSRQLFKHPKDRPAQPIICK
jgi:hypothetical protein